MYMYSANKELETNKLTYKSLVSTNRNVSPTKYVLHFNI